MAFRMLASRSVKVYSKNLLLPGPNRNHFRETLCNNSHGYDINFHPTETPTLITLLYCQNNGYLYKFCTRKKIKMQCHVPDRIKSVMINFALKLRFNIMISTNMMFNNDFTNFISIRFTTNVVHSWTLYVRHNAGGKE